MVGGATTDLNHHSVRPFKLHDSNIGSHSSSFGGVGRNIAENLARNGAQDVEVVFCSVVGNDGEGHRILDHLKSHRVNTENVVLCDSDKTALYSAMFDSSGELIGAIASMSIFENFSLDREKLQAQKNVDVVVFDCNFSEKIIRDGVIWFTRHNNDVHCWIEPTSCAKCNRCVLALKTRLVFGISPNMEEFKMLCCALLGRDVDPSFENDTDLKKNARLFFDLNVQVIVLKHGRNGTKIITRNALMHFEAPKPKKIVSVSGAGFDIYFFCC